MKSALFVAVSLVIFGVNCALGPPNVDFGFDETLSLERKGFFINYETENSVSGKPWKCVVCDEIVTGTHFLWSANRTQDCVANVIAYFCDRLPIDVDNHVCSAITSEFRDEVLYVVGKLLLSPNLICGLLLDECASPKPLFPEWTVALPPNKPKPQKLVKPKKGQPTLRVLHISDIHVDPGYSVGSEADCHEPLCCRKANRSKIKVPAGKWGTAAKCDIPLRTLENMFLHINRTEKIDYVLWTGDLMPHNVWGRTKANNIKLLKLLTKLFQKYFPRIPIFSAVGNHESSPVDSFPPRNTVPEKYSISWLYNTLAKEWTRFIANNTEITRVIKWRASYSVKLFDNLRIISINTQYCDKTNFWLFLNFTDPDGTLSWLVDELSDAERAGDKVHIIGHIPTGDDQCWNTWARNYYDIVNRFESTIRSQFFGHTHDDMFSVFYEDSNPKKRPTSVMFIAPSVTTYHYLFPAYRIYTIDGNYLNTTFSALDHETYMLNITEANLSDKPQWSFEYRASDAYNMKSAFAADWSNLIWKFARNDALFSKYWKFFKRTDLEKCSGKCKFNRLCQMRSGRRNPELCADLPRDVAQMTSCMHANHARKSARAAQQPSHSFEHGLHACMASMFDDVICAHPPDMEIKG